MADHGTVTLLGTALPFRTPGAYGIIMDPVGQGSVLAIMPPRNDLRPTGLYGLAGTLQPVPCPECPECPPPARFSLALGATPLGLALGDADT